MSYPRSFFSKLCLLFIVLTSLALPAFTQYVDSRFTDETYVSVQPYTPLGIAFSPDGRQFIWTKPGKIWVVKNGAVLATPFIDLTSRVNRAVDRGLIGFALDPDFVNNGYFYVAYVYENAGANTSDSPRTQRVSRFQADPANPNVALPNSETVLIGKMSTPPCPEPNNGADCIPNDMGAHTIDHLEFGPDGKLYVSVGEGSTYKDDTINSFRAQDLNSYNGKILRINKDGSAPADNPFYDGTNSVKSKIYSLGLRNPFRFVIDKSNGRLYIGDVGWTSYEEVDTGRGKNFGWPCFEGTGKQPTFNFDWTQCQQMQASTVTAPAYYYGRDVGSTVTMGAVYDKTVYPTEYRNRLFFADYTSKWIKTAAIDDAGNMTDVKNFATNLVDPVFLTLAPDGYIYYIAFSQGAIKRIKFNGSSNSAPVAKISANPLYGNSPLTVNFIGDGSTDADGDTLTYAWDFGDGATSTAANPSHSYNAAGEQAFTATLTVKDTSGSTDSASVRIVLNSTPPTANIVNPRDGTVVHSGDVINFSGNGTDAEDGQVPAGGLSWTVLLHHQSSTGTNAHYHTLLQTTGTGGQITIGDQDAIDSFWYEFRLTATDSSGLTSTQIVKLPYQAAQLCSMSTVDPSVTICQPGQNQSVSSPLRITAGTTSSYPVSTMKIYVDNVEKYSVNASTLDTSLALPDGAHNIVVQAWNAGGQVFKSSRQVTVGSTTGTGPCTLNTTSPSVTICQPTNGATVDSPVRIVAGTTSATPVTTMKIYVDNVEKYSVKAGQLDTSLALTAGVHSIVVQAWNSGGQVFKTPITITVNGGGGTTGPCTMNTVDPSVTVCQPTNGQTVASPVRFVAGTTSSSPVTAMKIYVDNAIAYSTNTGTLDTSLTLAPGNHYVVVQAWNQAGAVFKSTPMNISVSSTGGGDTTGCAAPGTLPGVNICSPTNGSTVNSPVSIVATAKSNLPIVAAKIYVDGVEKYTQSNSGDVNQNLSLSSGTRFIVVQAWDSSGAVFKSSVTVTVGGGTAPTCTIATIDPSVTICEPTQGTTVASPVHVVAGAYSSKPIVAIKIYVDGVEKFSQNNVNRVDQSIALASGKRFIVVQAWDSTGRVFNTSRTITVSP